MKTEITLQEIKSLSETKILSVTEKVGLLGKATKLKLMKMSDVYGKEYFNVVTRQGITNFMGDAQRAVVYGKKGIDYMEMKTAKEVLKFINQ